MIWQVLMMLRTQTWRVLPRDIQVSFYSNDSFYHRISDRLSCFLPPFTNIFLTRTTHSIVECLIVFLGPFSNKHIFTANRCENSNSIPFDYESPPFTTSPGVPPRFTIFLLYLNQVHDFYKSSFSFIFVLLKCCVNAPFTDK